MGFDVDAERVEYVTLEDVSQYALPEEVNPTYYKTSSIECIDAIRSALGDEGFVAFCRGNALKYLWRAGRKAPNASVDYAKSRWYTAMAAHVQGYGEDPRSNNGA